MNAEITEIRGNKFSLKKYCKSLQAIFFSCISCQRKDTILGKVLIFQMLFQPGFEGEEFTFCRSDKASFGEKEPSEITEKKINE